MSELKYYETNTDGITQTFRLSDKDAAARGFDPRKGKKAPSKIAPAAVVKTNPGDDGDAKSAATK